MKKGFTTVFGSLQGFTPHSLLFALLFCTSGTLSAQTGIASQGLWQEVKESDVVAESTDRLIVPSRYRVLRLDLSAIKSTLATAPAENNQAGYNNGIELHFPMADGTFSRFRVWYAPIMAPELAAKYPDIKTYAGYNLDDPGTIIRLDVTPAGFHAMTYGGGVSVFIDPYAKGNTKDYLCYFKHDFVKKSSDVISCLVDNDFTIDLKDKDKSGGQEFVGDCGIRHEYRLAVAATGEYTAFHGGTVALAMGAINTTMNRVNGVYEIEAAVRMILVGNNDQIVYVNAAADPYTNGDPNLMINENQVNVDAVIGNANYDIGHVFGTDSGGLAGLGVVCSNGNKARGVTGSGAPIGDPFDIDYVAHEIGHQFNARHTQYNDGCDRNNGTAIEPGSASTIMGYAGICAPDIQPNSHAYFSTASLFEMRPFVATGGGSGCDNAIVVANVSPTVTALANYSIPISTPFVQTASATDPNGSLTYCWEQIDAWVAPTQPMPPAANNLHGPVFRSLLPTTSPTRYFPNRTDLFNNVTPTWEVLPSIGRAMNFRVTVRDNFATAGCTGEASNTVTTVATAGPFVVTSPNTAVSYAVGSTQTVTWNVANTTAAPVSCANVDILFTSDGGATFTTLLANTPNDGSQAVTMPNTPTKTARIVVKCSDNIFFDVSNVNFKLAGPIVINEVDYDQPGADAAEFIELKNISANPVSLNGWSVELVNGANGGAVIYSTINLPNVNLAAGAYYVICANNANTPNCDLDVAPNADLIQNGAPDGIGLRNAGVLVDAVSYEGNTGAPYTETSGVGLVDGAGAANQGISRFPDGTDTDVNNVDLLSNVCISPGLPNLNTTANCVLPCDITAISFSNVGSCNDNGTSGDPSDDYFTANITVTFVNSPAAGNLTLSGDVLAGGGALSVAAPFTSPTVFSGVRLKADGTASVVTASFSADPGCTFTENNGPNVTSCSNAMCDLTSAGLNDVHCEDNNESGNDPNDDYIWFQLNPTGNDLGTGYNVTVSSGSVLLNGTDPANNVPYGNPQFFRLQAGSAGGGNVTIFIADANDPDCTISVEIVDPGSCSVPECSFEVACPPNPNIVYDCNTPIPAPISTEADFEALGGDIDGTYCGTLTITSVTDLIDNCNTTSITRTYTIFDDLDPANGIPDQGENSYICEITYTYAPDNTAPTFNPNPPLPGNITIACTDPLPMAPVLTGTDNCDNGLVPPVIFINEFHYDNTGADVGEFVEVAGTAGINLADYQIILYNGNGGVFYDTDALVGVIDNEGNGFGAVSLAYPVNGIQNGAPDGIALYRISTNQVIQFISYEGVFQATNGPAQGMLSTDVGVLELGTEPVGLSLQLTGTGQEADDFTWVGPIAQSPGTLNAGQTINPLPPSNEAEFMQTETPGQCAGSRIVTRTWTLTDACNNQNIHTQVITVTDMDMPVLTPQPANISLSCNDPIPPVPNVIGTDACDPDGIINGPVWINEIHYDNAGADVNEFIEIAGRAGTNLGSGYELYLYNGSTGMMGGTYDNISLSGIIPDLNNGYGTIAFFIPAIQNGPSDAIAFVKGGTVLQFLSYEGVMTAVGGPANGLVSTDIGVAETGNEPVGQSLRLSGNGTVYNDFVWNGPSAANPATPNGVNQGQTFPVQPPVGLPVTFSQTTMPGNCALSQTITRTWSTSDDCGNTAVHTQTITISDNAGPTIVCRNISVNLDIFGNVVVTQGQLIQSLSDNCSPNGNITVTPAGPFAFTCLQQGTTQTIVLTATDQCGNTSSCAAQVTINPFERCTPKVLITDPCVCKNNATTLTNGQFGETLKIESLAGKTWTVIANTGLYQANSPAPPSAPILIPVGTVLQENPVPSGDYYLNGVHVDALGYSITFRSERGEILTIGNQCEYPNPSITSDLSGPFCLFSDPVNLTGNPGDANIISQGFTVNGVPATVFDPGQGVGQYQIVYTVNGGTPKAFGPNDPGCIQSVKLIVNVLPTPSNLTCNNLVTVALDDETCSQELLPDMALEGSYNCFDDYMVELDETLPFGNGPWLPPFLDAGDIGKTYQFRVTHLVSGNKCWGTVKVEDKLAPVIVCENFSVPCNTPNLTPDYLFNTLGIFAANPTVTDCQSFTLSYIDTELAQNCASGLTKVITRKWTARDASGNTSTCEQTIGLIRPTLADVTTPPDYDGIDAPGFACTSSYPTPEWIENQGLQGFPYVFGQPTGCNLNWEYHDFRIEVCDGTYKIRREWTIVDWCIGDGIIYNQIIKVEDKQGPEMICPANLTVSVNPFNCCANVDLPNIVIADECSRINNIGGMVTTFDPETNAQTGMFLIGGSLQDFPGNNHWDPDTLAAFGTTTCLPVGSQIVMYMAEDDCGNATTCTFRLTIRDLVPPVASCDQTTTVAIGTDDPLDCYGPAGLNGQPAALDACSFGGVTWVKASTFNDGSYDQCNNLKLTIRRMTPYSDCIENLNANRGTLPCDAPNQSFPTERDLAITEQDSIKFYCCEVGTTQTIILAAYQVDLNGNIMIGLDGSPIKNECMIQVEVQDKLKPSCVPPSNVSVDCESFDPSLWTYGKAQVADNCCLDTSKEYQGQCGLTHSANYALFDTVCNKGTITRTFRSFDCYGQSSQCTQRVFVSYNQDYFLRFPHDAIVTACNDSARYDEPKFYGEDCELLGFSYEDEIFDVVPDACFKIERTWTIINWCTYNPNGNCIEVPNPNPNPALNHSNNLPGPTISACNTLPPWKSTVIKINPSDPAPTDYCVFWQKEANCYKYKQIIKVVDNQDPILDHCPQDTAYCDVSANNAGLWNNMDWWDPQLQKHDLCEGPVDLTITGRDKCSGSNVSAHFLLFMDLDNDGTMETVVNSINPPPPGMVYFGNANTPNFGGGVLRQFDNRGLPSNQSYRFSVLQSLNTTGTKKIFSARWNTQQFPNVYTPVEFPYGTHKIKWIITDGCGNETICEYNFTVEDCKAPTVVCLNGLSANIMPTGMIQLWASDFLQYTEDNCTPAGQLKIAIRKCGEGTGIPTNPDGSLQTSVAFNCSEIGTQCVELWSVDAAGNADYCETYLIVQDNLGGCATDFINVGGDLRTEMSEGIEEAMVKINGISSFTPPFAYFDLSDASGHYEVMNNLPLDATFEIAPEKTDNPLNGVTTYDLVLISQHILAMQALDSPYKIIAADANKSGSVTTFDIVEIRKLILGIYTELPDNDSWRFIDYDFVFPNPQNPFATAIPESISVANAFNNMMNEDFMGVKVGDVNNSAIPNLAAQSEERNQGVVVFDLDNKTVIAGQTFEVSFQSAQELAGFQFTLLHDGLELLDVTDAPQVNAQNFGKFEGKTTVSIDGAQAFTLRFLANKSGLLRDMIQVSGSITRAEAYTRKGERRNVALRFDGKTIAGLDFELYQNQPNPFINKTTIGFFLPEASEATLSVLDETGRLVYQQKGQFPQGENTIVLDRSLLNTSGVLYYKLETETASATRKMIQAK
ncbi:MAG TPA: hypothetical protein DCF33_01185 [Saprospirales bacterium]|nr:hypothetical protein [Saprospirales bacterium]